MLIQRQQIVHLRQRWIAAHQTHATAEAVVNAHAAAARDAVHTLAAAAATAGSYTTIDGDDGTDGGGGSGSGNGLAVDTSPARGPMLMGSGGLGGTTSPRQRQALDARHMPSATPGSGGGGRGSGGGGGGGSAAYAAAGTPLHASASEFLRRELVKLKLEGFLDTHTDVTTLAAEYLRLFTAADVQWIFGLVGGWVD